MNEAHEMCGSPQWRQLMRDVIIPWALGGADLGADVLEIGPGYCAATDALADALPHLTAVEIDPTLAELLSDRFADTSSVDVVVADATALPFPNERFTGAACFTMLHHVPTAQLQDRLFTEAHRVLRPGSTMVASDSLAGPDLAAMHDGDTYNPVDPASLPARLTIAGFTDIAVSTNEFGWAAVASRP